jgi:hypothetical protein
LARLIPKVNHFQSLGFIAKALAELKLRKRRMPSKERSLMKSTLLSLSLIPLLLTGCTVAGGYYSDYPGYYGPDYYGGSYIGFSYYDGGRYHDYHHYDSGYHHGTVAYHGTSHASGHAFANVSRSGGHVGGSRGASVSSGGHRY